MVISVPTEADMCLADMRARTAGLLLPVSKFLQQSHRAHSEALSLFQILGQLWNGRLCVLQDQQ